MVGGWYCVDVCFDEGCWVGILYVESKCMLEQDWMMNDKIGFFDFGLDFFDGFRLYILYWGVFFVWQGMFGLEVRFYGGDFDFNGIIDNFLGVFWYQVWIVWLVIWCGWFEWGLGLDDCCGWDEFVYVSWDKVFDLFGDEFGWVCDSYGFGVVFGGFYGWLSVG